MKCESCEAPATAEQLAQGRCLACTAKENTIFRLLLSHTVMAIQSGQPSTHPTFGVCYTQEFGEAFLNHMRQALSAVKRLNVPSPPATPTSQRCKCGAHMTAQWAFEDDEHPDYIFNVYGCEYCGMLLKIMASENSREIWIRPEA